MSLSKFQSNVVNKPIKLSKREKKNVKKIETKRSKNKLKMLEQEFGTKPLEKYDWSNTCMKVPLQAHQVEAQRRIQKQRAAWGEFSNALFLDIPMGYGKTINGLDTIVDFLKVHGNDPAQGEMKSKGILIICSSGDLRNQWCEEIKSKTNIPIESSVFIWKETKNFPKVPTNGIPFIVLTTYRILLLANDKNILQPFERNKWKMIITDEAHMYRNYQTCTSVALLRLVLGKKASPDLMKRLKKSTKNKNNKAIDILKDDIVKGRKRFSDLLQDCPQEGSPASFRMFLSGTVMVNSIVDLLIHAMLINQSMEECQNHDEEDNECVGHAFNSEAWWRKNLFVLVKDKDSLSEEEYVKGEEIYREFIQEFFISFDEDYISMALELPKRTVITHKLDFIPGSVQQKAYDTVAHTLKMFLELFHDPNQFADSIENINAIRNHIVVCIQFLTMLGLHPACIKAELTRKEKDISVTGKLLLEAYLKLGFKDMPYQEQSVKVTEIIHLIKKIKKHDPNAQIIIFSAYRSFQDILYWHLAKTRGYKRLARYHGGMSRNKKTDELERFKNGEADVLLSVFKAGNLGLNLTCATHMIMCEPPYTHADWIQAVCRMYRIGQKKPVFIYDLIMSNSVDIWRMSKNTYKYGLQKNFRERPCGTIEKSLTLKDTQDLYNSIVTSSSELDEETMNLLKQQEAQILKLHVAKVANDYEKLMNDYDMHDDADGKDDGYVFEFDEFIQEDNVESEEEEDVQIIETKDEIQRAVDEISENEVSEEDKPLLIAPAYKRQLEERTEEFDLLPIIVEPLEFDVEVMELLNEIPHPSKKPRLDDLIEF